MLPKTVVPLLCLLNGANAYSSNGRNNRRSLKPMGVVSERSPTFDSSSLSESNQRRNVLASLTIATSAAVATALSSKVPLMADSGDSIKSSSSTSSTMWLSSSVDEAIALIESSCDRRFLHGVVASDYRLMYRGMTAEEARAPSIRSEPSDLLLPSTYDSLDAANFFASLDKRMENQPIQPSNGHLATTDPEAAKSWGGEAVSIWPLGENVHFAWLEEGEEFWSKQQQRSLDVKSLKVIVDGIDCGRMSLEDALESNNKEIMFRADRFLAVPTGLEKQLVQGLRDAFII